MVEHEETSQNDELVALREDETRCLRILAACRRFAVNLGGDSGYYATLAQNEEVLLDAFWQVVKAHQDPTGAYDQLFAQRTQRAGLTPTDVQRLKARLQWWLTAQDEEEE
ncbi:hypothetical protein [Ktedonospora formicarum]|uniref:Uncharacterized protein n=1 Tax=Ktedonospora formicarum TaxID=2778364 RepID=A0A8J3HRQ2_9CHLR|nr:hypothetical protein [Ktedonospora formicarum]GHO42389.1 hypothetical protein KSX_05520 [Ktedonospora formicarum]